jgi:hypothetical protein
MPVLTQYTFTEKSGDTLDYDLTVTESGVPVDLTLPSTQIWFTGKVNKASADNQATWQKTIGSGITVTGAGTARITLLPADTENLADGTVVFFDTQVKLPTGRVQTPFEGSITFESDVTQSTS